MTGSRDIFEIRKQILTKYVLDKEEKLRIAINDKPKWLPNFIWYRLIRFVIREEYFV